MGTKNNPSDFDCYTSADPDEEMFVLLGRDRHASALVGLWALMREKEGEDPALVAEARGCAERLAAEAQRRGKPVLTLDAVLAMAASLQQAAVEAAPDTRPLNDPPVAGDVVVAHHGIAGLLTRVFGPEDPDTVRGWANVRYPNKEQVTTVKYDQLRRAIPEELAAYRAAGGGR